MLMAVLYYQKLNSSQLCTDFFFYWWITLGCPHLHLIQYGHFLHFLWTVQLWPPKTITFLEHFYDLLMRCSDFECLILEVVHNRLMLLVSSGSKWITFTATVEPPFICFKSLLSLTLLLFSSSFPKFVWEHSFMPIYGRFLNITLVLLFGNHLIDAKNIYVFACQTVFSGIFQTFS